MCVARYRIVDRSESGYYHCITRCVRQAFLCGGEFEHRRDWIRQRARELASIFAIDVCSIGVLHNHYHIILRPDPELAREWSDEEVRTRFKRLYPGSAALARAERGLALGLDDECRQSTKVLRERLCDLSWFMRAMNERIARAANDEEGRTGRFWEGRFKSIRLLDKEALLECCMYVDLNEIRAGVAETPETSKLSSVYDRIQVKHMHEKRRGERAHGPGDVDALVPFREELAPLATDQAAGAFRKDELGIWTVPIECAPAGAPKPKTAAANRRRGLLDMTLDTYLQLVDTFGRVLRDGKAAIKNDEKPILDRLRLDPERLSVFLGLKRLFGTVAGAAPLVKKEAQRRKCSHAMSINRS